MIDQAKVDEFKAKHGDVYLLTSGDAELLVRCPTRAEFKLFMSTQAKPEMRYEAVERLVKQVLLFPAQDAFIAMLEKKPGLCGEFADKVADIAGITGQATSAKL